MLHACVQKFDVTDTVGNFLRITLQYTQTKLLHQERTVHVYRTKLLHQEIASGDHASKEDYFCILRCSSHLQETLERFFIQFVVVFYLCYPKYGCIFKQKFQEAWLCIGATKVVQNNCIQVIKETGLVMNGVPEIRGGCGIAPVNKLQSTNF